MNKIITALITLGILISAFFALNSYIYKEKQDSPDQIFCTMEALLCPDGSAVGRIGPECKFSACPTPKHPITGKLRQTQNGFELLIASPPNENETTYVLPLKVKVSNILDTLINKQVNITGYYNEGNIFEADQIEPSKNSNPELGEIKIGETVYINGLKISILALLEDSRCPIDSICIQKGQVRLLVFLKSSTDTEEVIISDNQVEVFFDSFKVSLIKTKSSAQTSVPLKETDYLFTFKVSE